MVRFDVYSGTGRGLLLDCQADQFAHFSTRFVVPLLPTQGVISEPRLQPILEVAGSRFVMTTQLAFAILVRVLGHTVANLRDEHSRIINAPDMLLTGH